MNKIYKLVWNNVRGCYVVASEFAKAHGKSARRAVVGAFVATVMVGGMGTANAAPTGEGAVIYGYEVEASRTSTAWGDKSKAVGEISTAFGFGTYSSGRTSTAWGDSTTAIGDMSTAFGFATYASGHWSTAWGYYSKAVGESSTAFGNYSKAWGNNSLAALGGTTGKENSKDLGYGAVAIGEGSLALDKFTYAIGNGAAATDNNTLAIGNGATATLSNALALGNGAIAKHYNSVALGSGSVTDRKDCISVGNRQITFVRPGQLDTDAANVGQVREEKNRALAAEQANADAVSAEKVRAMTAEEANKKAIADLAAGKLLGDVENFKLGDAFTGELVETKEGKKYFAMDINEYGNIKFADMGKENLNVVLSGNGFYAQDSDATTEYETSLDEKGLMIKAGDSKVSITAKGVDLGGSKITNVAAGEVDTDAVNVQQLNAAVAGAVKVDGQNIVKDADGTINLSNSVQTTLGQVANKADKSYVDAELSKKANVADVNAELSKKANIADVNAELSKKANVVDVNAELSKKANSVDVYTKTEADDKMVDTFDFGSSHIYGLLEEQRKDIDSLLGKSVLGGNSLAVGKGLTADYDDAKQTYTVAIKENIDDTFHFAKATADMTGKAVDINANGVVASKTSGGIAYKAALDQEGLAITQNDKGVNITATGIDMGGSKIGNVAAGAAATDAVNKGQLDAEATRAQAAEKVNADAIAAEATRAQAAEKANADAIAAEATRAQAAETQIDGKVTVANKQIETNRSNIETLMNSKAFEGVKIKFDDTGVLKGEYDEATKTYTIKTKENIGDTLSFTDNTTVGDNGVDIGKEGFSAHKVDSNNVGYLTKVDSEGIIIAKGEQRVTITAEGIEGVYAVGIGNKVTGANSTAVGYGNKVYSQRSGAFGDPNTLVLGADDSYVIGNDNYVEGSKMFVLGNGVTVAADVSNSIVLGDHSKVSESNVVSVGAPGSERKIVNVADPENPTDAVNLRTLEAKLGNTEALDAISNRVNSLDSKINRTGAHAAALAALRPADFDGKLSVAAGLGNYHGSQAGAVGLFYKPTDRISFNLGGTMGGKENMANFGVSFALDRVVPHSISSRSELNKKLQALSAENAEMKAENADMRALVANQAAENAAMKAEIAELKAMVMALANK